MFITRYVNILIKKNIIILIKYNYSFLLYHIYILTLVLNMSILVMQHLINEKIYYHVQKQNLIPFFYFLHQIIMI